MRGRMPGMMHRKQRQQRPEKADQNHDEHAAPAGPTMAQAEDFGRLQRGGGRLFV